VSRTPAAELARLKIAYQGWLIERAAEGTGFAAQLRDERGGLRAIYAPTVAELETALARAEAEAER
jgi:hypothetical protein